MADRTELLLMLASRAQHTEEVLIPALERGKIVLCDRYNDSTMAYQSYGRGFDFKLTHDMCSFASHKLVPDRTYLFDIDISDGIERSRRVHKDISPEGSTDRMESAGQAFHQRVRDGFLELACKYPERFIVFDARKPIEELHKEIVSNMAGLIKG